MAIFIPGRRDRHNRPLGNGKRSVVAILSLTAMVDMFTVLAVFLLQNYRVTGQVLEIDESVNLPDARAVKELKPSNVVTISKNEILFNNEKVSDFVTIKEQSDWIVPILEQKIIEMIKKGKEAKLNLRTQLREAVKQAQEESGSKDEELDDFLKLTIQADREIDFLTIKKIMYTVTEGGIVEINFAVIKRGDEEAT